MDHQERPHLGAARQVRSGGQAAGRAGWRSRRGRLCPRTRFLLPGGAGPASFFPEAPLCSAGLRTDQAPPTRIVLAHLSHLMEPTGFSSLWYPHVHTRLALGWITRTPSRQADL